VVALIVTRRRTDERQPCEQGNAELRSKVGPRRSIKQRTRLAAAPARVPAHVLDNAEHTQTDLAGTPNVTLHGTARFVARDGDDEDTGEPGDQLGEVLERVRAGREIGEKHVERAPVDVGEELTQHAGLDEGAPCEALSAVDPQTKRRTLGEQQVCRHDADAIGRQRRLDAIRADMQWTSRAEEAGRRRALQVAVDHANATLSREGARERGGDVALAHAAFSAHDSDRPLDTAQPVGHARALRDNLLEEPRPILALNLVVCPEGHGFHASWIVRITSSATRENGAYTGEDMIAAPFDKAPRINDRSCMSSRRLASAPLPLLVGFALFLAGLVWLVAASLTRRDAPVFALSAPTRTRASSWMVHGDTLTVDATEGEQWRYASLTLGRALEDSAGWEIAVRRHNITVAGALTDLGDVQFEAARVPATAVFVSSAARENANDAIKRWYTYSLVTHLLHSQGHVYALRARDGRMWKLQVLGYYCPGLTAGCLTIRYAPVV